MKENNPYHEDKEQLREILRQYENLRNGRSHSFLEEEAFEILINYYLDNDDIVKAAEAAETGCEQFPYSSVLLVKKADVLLANHRFREALHILEQVTVLDGSDINVYILKTDAYLALNMQEKAAHLLDEALNVFEGEEKIELLFELADVYDDHEDFDKVFDCLKLVLNDEPNNEEALHKICFWTDFTGRNEESIKLHQHIIDEYPYNELAWFNLGAAYQGLKLYEKSIDAYQYALAIDDKFDYAYRNMGDAYIRLRKYKDAIEVLEKVTELAQPEDVIFEALGYCHEKLKKYIHARNYYRKASHLRQDDSRLYYKIATTYYHEGNWEGCLKQLDTALQIHKMQPEYNLMAGECKMKLGQIKEAVQYFTNVVSVRPKTANGWEALIRCLYQAGYFEEAQEQTEAALFATMERPIFNYYKVAVLLALGKSKEALLLLEVLLQKHPKMLKRLVSLNPSILQNQQVVDVIARSKRNKPL